MWEKERSTRDDASASIYIKLSPIHELYLLRILTVTVSVDIKFIYKLRSLLFYLSENLNKLYFIVNFLRKDFLFPFGMQSDKRFVYKGHEAWSFSLTPVVTVHHAESKGKSKKGINKKTVNLTLNNFNINFQFSTFVIRGNDLGLFVVL